MAAPFPTNQNNWKASADYINKKYKYLYNANDSIRPSAPFRQVDLQRLINPFGCVDYAKMRIDPFTGLSNGKGIVEMKHDDHAKKAMAALQGKVLGMHPLNIKEAKERSPKIG